MLSSWWYSVIFSVILVALSSVLLACKHLHEIFLVAGLGLLRGSLRVNRPKVFDCHNLILKIASIKLFRLAHMLLLWKLRWLISTLKHVFRLVWSHAIRISIWLKSAGKQRLIKASEIATAENFVAYITRYERLLFIHSLKTFKEFSWGLMTHFTFDVAGWARFIRVSFV